MCAPHLLRVCVCMCPPPVEGVCGEETLEEGIWLLQGESHTQEHHWAGQQRERVHSIWRELSEVDLLCVRDQPV